MYRKSTRGIEVTVEPEFSPERSRREVGQYFWTYSIEIRNLSTETVQLRARHWIITDADGQVQHVRGLGVVGEQPILRPGDLYRYASGCPLTTSHGIMVGTYEMVSAGGERFEVDIPAFSLDMPADRRVLN
jgi:ApaG protein